MYLFYLRDGTILGTTSIYMIAYIRRVYGNDPGIRMETFCENLDAAIEKVDHVLE